MWAISDYLNLVLLQLCFLFEEFITIGNNRFVIYYRKIFYAYDTCHLLKSTRNIFLMHKYIFEDFFTSWTYVVNLYDNDKIKENRLCPRLTDSHVQSRCSRKCIWLYTTAKWKLYKSYTNSIYSSI
ncbi:hypothetical protein PUN28_017777 [Cardiocondyla obscurior]|uniref:Uncharacterized protein n=1 Tax=Cardiocondyla obscurior TaxID=286306 RepID=A0AAW2EPX5_9HYME